MHHASGPDLDRTVGESCLVSGSGSGSASLRLTLRLIPERTGARWKALDRRFITASRPACAHPIMPTRTRTRTDYLYHS